MKTIEEYRTDMRTILGDAAGRRYTESVLDMGLRQSLDDYQTFCPLKKTILKTVTAVEGNSVEIAEPPDSEILTIRDAEGHWLQFTTYRTELHLYLVMYSMEFIPAVGNTLTLEISCPHIIKGLDSNTNDTSIPDGHALTIAGGAAGYAMRIRARSVTEVFGKRPEDREALSSQANRLITDFLKELSRIQPAVFDPMPRGEFPI